MQISSGAGPRTLGSGPGSGVYLDVAPTDDAPAAVAAAAAPRSSRVPAGTGNLTAAVTGTARGAQNPGRGIASRHGDGARKPSVYLGFDTGGGDSMEA